MRRDQLEDYQKEIEKLKTKLERFEADHEQALAEAHQRGRDEQREMDAAYVAASFWGGDEIAAQILLFTGEHV